MSIASIGTRSTKEFGRSIQDKKLPAGQKAIVMSIDEIQRIKESCSLNKEKDQEI
jgi:hypothetical protein